MRLLLPGLIVVALGLVYALTLASFAWEDLAVGLALGSGLLVLYRREVLPGPAPRAGFVLHALLVTPRLLALLAIDIVRGTWQVASIVLGLRPLSHPGIVKIPLLDLGAAGSAFVAFVVTLSPGSFLVEFDWDERVMLVHYVDISDPERIRADVRKYYEVWMSRAPAAQPVRRNRDA